MTKDYGQYCGLSHALDLIGGRWTLLIVRDLLTGPKRFTDLEHGLPGIPTNVLSARLKEMEDAGLVERTLLARPLSGFAYQLTAYGRDLEDPLMRLGLWGARSLPGPGPHDYFSYSSLAMGLRAMFNADAASGITLRFRIESGEQELRGAIERGDLTIPDVDTGEPDLTISAEPAVVADLIRGTRTIDHALASNELPFAGSEHDLRRFFSIFDMSRQSTPAASASSG